MNSDKYNIVETRAAIKRVRLIHLAKVLNVKSDVLFSILREAGYVVHGNPYSFVLNENHLKIISNVYSKSVKSFFNRTKKTVDKISETEKQELFNFFKLFLSGSEIYDKNSIYSGHLETSLIEKYFFSIVSSLNYSKLGNNLVRNNYFQLKIKIFKSFIERKQKIISTFINYCYYNFSTDEDSARGNLNCFS